jgi:hypothetical protein
MEATTPTCHRMRIDSISRSRPRGIVGSSLTMIASPTRWPPCRRRHRPDVGRYQGLDAVAEPAGGFDQRNPRLDHHRGVGVPEVVHADARLAGVLARLASFGQRALSPRWSFPGLVPRWSRESGVQRPPWVNSGQIGLPAGGEAPGQKHSRPGGECGASWNRTSDLTLIRTARCDGVCRGQGRIGAG